MTYSQTLTRQTAIASINFYQNHISPHKGFSCPHRQYHGGLSCSEQVKQFLQYHSLGLALHLSLSRLRECSAASQSLRQTQVQGGCIVIPCCLPI
uniref:Membrane protein insertion efficiency factor YidD n=1 Tax=Cyanothece sp. (strain PCC 7425 / ATCC 29141) TaxID=395961 RepID=B8HQU3_CYAP4